MSRGPVHSGQRRSPENRHEPGETRAPDGVFPQNAGMSLPLQPPLKPMLAKPAKAIPDSGGLLFEPKWDGFRCIAFRDGEELYLQSRAEKPLNRYFP